MTQRIAPNNQLPKNTEIKNIKTGEWIFYKSENWNIYKLLNDSVLIHPETDNGISNGSIIDVLISEID